MIDLETVEGVKELARALRKEVEEFLNRTHEAHMDELAYFITKIDPSLGLIDRLAAQRLLTRSVTYDLVRRVIVEQLPEEFLVEEVTKEEEEIFTKSSEGSIQTQ